jgi:uncharacterized protein (DUF4415 family)
MLYEWDERKRLANIAEHKVDFALAIEISRAIMSKPKTSATTTKSRALSRSASSRGKITSSSAQNETKNAASSRLGASASVGKEDIRTYSLADLRAMRRRGEVFETPADAPTYELPEWFWKRARVVVPASKASVHLRVDRDVLEWFKRQGKGHLTRMNAVLKSYVYAQMNRALRAAVAAETKRKRPAKRVAAASRTKQPKKTRRS